MMSPALSSSTSRRRRVLLAVSTVVSLAAPLVAHDMWIEPTTFSPRTGQIVGVRLRVGQDLLGDPLPRDPALVNQFVVVDAEGRKPVVGRDGARSGRLRARGGRPACSSSAIAATRAPSSWRPRNSISI